MANHCCCFFCWNMAGWLFCKWCVKCICKQCDHRHQQMRAESKTRGKVMLDSFHRCFFAWLYVFTIFTFSSSMSFWHPHFRNECSVTKDASCKSSLFFLSLALTPSPSPYLCIYASLILIFLPWEPRKPSSHLLTPPFSKCTKGFLSACLHSWAQRVLL